MRCVHPAVFARGRVLPRTAARGRRKRRERQHTEAIPIMDRRMTVSGVDRGKQRAIYDQRRRDVLPQHGIELVQLSYADFAHDKNKRLCRRRLEDLVVVRQALAKWIG
jgi:hypothetical protein